MRAKQILSDEDVNTIFTNTQKLYEIHSKLLSELKGNKDRFGEIFLANVTTTNKQASTHSLTLHLLTHFLSK